MEDLSHFKLTNKDLFEITCMRLERSNAAKALFGNGLDTIRPLIRPFLIGGDFPEIYLEFPLKGEPFLDATVLYNDIENVKNIDSPLAGNCKMLLERFSRFREDHKDICFGFEIDSDNSGSAAAVHFQPYGHMDLVEPFLESIGEGSYSDLYKDFVRHSGPIWPPSFFGIFRGRPSYPLRVCGYVNKSEYELICSSDTHLRDVFDHLSFKAYDDKMIGQIQEVFSIAPLGVDYQMDIYPDNTMGTTFSLDIALPDKYEDSVAKLFKKLGIADDRCDHLKELVLNIAIPDCIENENIGFKRIKIKPAWLKIRWKDKVLQNSKCYTMLRAFEIKDQEIPG